MIATIHDPEAVRWAIAWAGFGFVVVVILAYLWFAPEPPDDEAPEVEHYGPPPSAMAEERRAEGSIRHWTGSGWRS